MRRKADILSLTDKSLPTGNNGVLRRAIIKTVNTAIRAGKRINMHFLVIYCNTAQQRYNCMVYLILKAGLAYAAL